MQKRMYIEKVWVSEKEQFYRCSVRDVAIYRYKYSKRKISIVMMMMMMRRRRKTVTLKVTAVMMPVTVVMSY